MSYLLEKLNFFTKKSVSFSKGHGQLVDMNRNWEKAYRQRWQHDKIVRSTHGVNCTGSCSWKIYVKNGLIAWETQQVDYPATRNDLPDHEPRGCQRGASSSWYIYSAARLKYPLIRSTLVHLWRTSKEQYENPVSAWGNIVNDVAKSKQYKIIRGLGGFVRTDWEEVTDIIASSNIFTIKKYGPDRLIGFSPIPAMSMVSYAAGSRYLSLIGGACLSFYDWYCDLPPSSPQTWGEQTDVPESADWYNSTFIILWGSNVPQTRTPDAHFFTEVRYKGAKTIVATPDYSEAAKLSDLWVPVKPGTDSALAMAIGHVILTEYHIDEEARSEYFSDYVTQYTDMPFLVILKQKTGGFIPDRLLRSSDFSNNLNCTRNPEWNSIIFDNKTSEFCIPNGTIGSRWDGSKKWNLELKNYTTGNKITPLLTLIENYDEIINVGFPYYGSKNHEHYHYTYTSHDNILWRRLPAKVIAKNINHEKIYVTTVFDLMVANYGIDRYLGGSNVASSYDDEVPYTPQWQEQITGVKSFDVITIARQFADNAEATRGKSMVIIGAAMNHWYHMDMNYRGVINILAMCGCIGKSGGGWAHYVGQEKLRPQAGWAPLAFGLDWSFPPRLMNGTSFFYLHTNQWRYERIQLKELLSPVADKKKWNGLSLVDCNAKSERMGWLPSAPQLEINPIKITQEAIKAGKHISEYVVNQMRQGKLTMSCEDPDNEKNFPRILFIWRSNILGSSGKGHEYFLKHLLGTQHGVIGKNLDVFGGMKPKIVKWHEKDIVGKLDLLVTLDFRMSTTCLYSDIVLPTASWYEKNDLNTSDMHPFIHPLSAAVDPVWESKSDWDIYKDIARRFSEIALDNLGIELDTVLSPLLHDSPNEMGQALNVKDWKNNECEMIPGKTMPIISVVQRDYPNTYEKFTSVGPLLEEQGNGGKGLKWNTKQEIQFLAELNGTVEEYGLSKGFVKIETSINAAEVILTLAPETNGGVAVKAWNALSQKTGLDHSHLAKFRKHEQLRFANLLSQPRKIISSPIWSGLESDSVSYNSGYTNVHELIPWRTITGRQQLYQDHLWMRDFGEGLCVYKPPVDTKTTTPLIKDGYGKQNKYVLLNLITPHQKWAIHSTFSDNLIMLTLNRGGPIVWVSENNANKIGIIDNDWVEAYNVNGAIVARAVVSQRLPDGMMLMYHAQEKIVNVPVSEITKYRGGIHNSPTRAYPKPTHMIGGYVHQSYGFNYHGTVGSNRDEFIILSKLKEVDWGITIKNQEDCEEWEVS